MRDRTPRACKYPACNNLFEPRSTPGRTPVYCSIQCKERDGGKNRPSLRVEHECPFCGNLFHGQSGRKFCSRSCALKVPRPYMGRMTRILPPSTCANCGGPTRRPTCKFCSFTCHVELRRKIAASEKRVAIKAAIKRSNWSKCVARRRAVTALGEKISARKIFQRDNWTCKLCGDPINQSLKWPDPWSPSLDHIVPLKKGGQHVIWNVQTAHLRCNVRKQDSFPEQANVNYLKNLKLWEVSTVTLPLCAAVNPNR